MKAYVNVEHGTIEGLANDGIHTFFGIPYAAPPTGPLRWRAPARPLAWEGVRDATHFGASAMQTVGASFHRRSTKMSEDCLYLNVWAPGLDEGVRKPVMVWIHGGGNLGGSGCEDAFDGAAFARDGVVLVTFNYRLGAFGFLAHPSLGANFAVLDWVAALSWVRDNIAHFGGDPNNVTIFGESAGAVAVRTLISTPDADGLFHKAILQSAGFEKPAFAQQWTYERAEAHAETFLNSLGTRDPDELRQLPTQVLNSASHTHCGLPPPPGRIHTPANLVWMPVVDGQNVLEDARLFSQANIPLLMGCTQNEARYFVKPGNSYSKEQLAAMIGLFGGRASDQLAEAVMDGRPVYDQIDQLFTTAIWHEPAHETASRLAQRDRQLYVYHFQRVSPGAAMSNELAKHTGEIRYVFNTLTEDGYYDSHDQAIATAMQTAWINFARHGVPSTPDTGAWPLFTATTPQITLLGDHLSSASYEPSDLIKIIGSTRRALG